MTLTIRQANAKIRARMALESSKFPADYGVSANAITHELTLWKLELFEELDALRDQGNESDDYCRGFEIMTRITRDNIRRLQDKIYYARPEQD